MSSAAPAESTLDPDREIARLGNELRQQAQVANLQWHPKLAQAALDHSQEMASKGYFGHQSPTPNRVELAQRLALVGAHEWTAIAENIYQSSGNLQPQNCLDLWLKSPGHRENLLDSQYSHTGVGVARSRTGKIYVTQVFASFSQEQFQTPPSD